jgi:hypothetical protein
MGTFSICHEHKGETSENPRWRGEDDAAEEGFD